MLRIVEPMAARGGSDRSMFQSAPLVPYSGGGTRSRMRLVRGRLTVLPWLRPTCPKITGFRAATSRTSPAPTNVLRCSTFALAALSRFDAPSSRTSASRDSPRSSKPVFPTTSSLVVHAALGEGCYAFRDHLALGDADFVIGPLTRTTAACFTVRPLPPVRVTTRKTLDAINAIFLRAAQVEVACHPDDANATRQTHSRLDRLPPRILTGR